MPIVVDNVSYTYAPGTAFETAALSGVSVTVEDGEFVGIMGRTGCGKSTLLQLMAGLLRPSSGRIMLDGKDINARGYRRDELREKVGLLFQFPECQLFESTVERDVAFGLKHLPLPAEEKAARVRWALEAVGFSFESIRHQSPLGLSGGEKRRVAIAGVLAVKPKILLLDEPAASLDPVGRREFMELMQRLHREGTTIVMISHDADILGEYAQRILVLDRGKLRLAAPVKEIFKDIAGMEALNLDVSRPRKIAHLLQKRGVPLPQDITGYGELLVAIRNLKKGCLIS